MSYEYSEDGLVENAAQEVLEDLGWKVVTAWHKESFSVKGDRSDGLLGRANKSEVVLVRDLTLALKKLNPNLPELAYQSGITEIIQVIADKSLGAINKIKHQLLTKGVQVSYQDDKGILQKKRLKVFNFNEPTKNEFLAVRQLEVVGKLYNRRPDIVGFVNGIPLVFFELKAHHQDLRHAYDDNLSDYKDTISEVLHCNAFIILSNGTDACVGTVTSKYKFFLEWKRIEENDEGVVSLDTILRGTCDKTRLLDLFENFLLFDGEGDDVIKLMAKNHQFIGVNKVVDQTRNIEDLKGKLGVFWHTQGSGKSYSMVFLTQKILRKFGGSYTFLIVVDRTELENQLYDTFSGCGAIPEQLPKRGIRAKSRDHLRELMAENHRYVFSLIHKFSIDPKKETEYPELSDRKNIIVISDEAHRTQGGKFARNMRFKAIPNASFLGFTGTPLIAEEVELTKNIFGEYVSVYDFKMAIADGATLPLRYFNRGEKLDIENPDLDQRMADIINNEDLDQDQIAKLKREFARDYPILTSDDRLDKIAKDLVWHFNDRGYQGKAMFVALDKPTAVRMYDLVMSYWPEYLKELKQRLMDAEDEQQALTIQKHYDRVKNTEVCVVVSSEQNEVKKFKKLGLDIETHRKKVVERDLEKEFKDEDNPFRLAFVCAMWITGFDAQCVSTVYLDKPIQGHTLMQTIARANRVYDDEKENGLIVDYGNVYKQLEKAYSVYGEGGKSKPGGKGGGSGNPAGKLEELEAELVLAIVAVKEFLSEVDFNLDELVNAPTAMEKLGQLNKAANAVCLNETTRTQFEVAARDVFRKYLAQYPSDWIKPYTKEFNAIEAIYTQLNQNTKSADISDIMRKLQQEVSMSVSTKTTTKSDDDYVDLSTLDFDKLQAAFAKSTQKNAIVFNLQEAIEQQLQKMIQQNPIRLEFYDKYKQIIEEYNAGKDLQAVQKAFDDVKDYWANVITPEVERAAREGLNEESLAIFDLLKKSTLSKKEEAEVKKVAQKTLEILKEEKLKVDRWRESTQVKSQVKTIIGDSLQYLPQAPYPDDELADMELVIYQHVYSNYQGAGMSTYGGF
ncbi:type I restriction endonuclease subunit R [Colwellia demingiae]|uniref:Type I restriction enzyme endonuclease subunit n=1 Tax=Colwellia demingiae TaxID=89401 RepID=A0A5C6QRZ8_9GAMM|nr:type I restriction endonuclease subunit R [Colwellia demingiae]TWX71724.1 type I restriction endonuclease subunit R [Colwellia demingiae]